MTTTLQAESRTISVPTPSLTYVRSGLWQHRTTNRVHSTPVPSAVHEVLRSPGQPLDPGVRASMESRFGHDFSRVSVRTAAPMMIQPKLTIGQPGDKYEQEADRVADLVVRIPDPRLQRQVEPDEKNEEMLHIEPLASQITPLVQTQVQSEEEEEPIQIKWIPARTLEATPSLEARIQDLRGGGQPLSESIRSSFELRLGHDFSQVRIHADSRGNELAKAINARAFTLGHNVVFGGGHYAPETSEGWRLLAHELTHVVQQCGSHSQPQSVIQRWKPGVHEELTREGTEELFSGYPGFRMNHEALSNLAEYSTAMDFRPGEMVFNVKAYSITHKARRSISPPFRHSVLQRPQAPRLTEKERHQALVSHYSANPEHAKNHGEGGLYSMPRSSAATENKKRQIQYETRGRREFNKLNWKFGSERECRETKSKAREDVLKVLGDALHVAQDRGSHEEGAIGCRHDNTDFDCDDPDENGPGYAEAQENTWEVLSCASDFLYDIFENVCRWQYSRPAEVRITRI